MQKIAFLHRTSRQRIQGLPGMRCGETDKILQQSLETGEKPEGIIEVERVYLHRRRYPLRRGEAFPRFHP